MTHLADLTWPAAGRRSDAVLVLPLGSTEQHGPHLPLSTDTDIAVALCQALARRRDDVLVAPAMAYGASGEHAGFPGTLSIGTAALELVLIELGRSAFAFVDRLLFVCAHGGNTEAVLAAVARLRYEAHEVSVFFPRWSGDAHAGRSETSLQLALDARRVTMDDAEPGNVAALPDLLPDLLVHGVRAVSPNGVLGDPTGANAVDGVRLLRALTDDLEAHVVDWLAVDDTRPTATAT
jgi:mycofactocin precursor peptide peptidase